jgi:magnesium transporter
MLLVPERTRAWIDQVRECIETEQYDQAAALIINLSDAQVASLLLTQPRSRSLPFLSAIGPDRAAQVMIELPVEFAAQLIGEAGADQANAWLSRMPVDITTDLLASTPAEDAEQLLAALPEEKRIRIANLAHYADDTVGAVMSPYFSAVRSGETITATIAALRGTHQRFTRTGYVYCVDSQGRLEGVASLRDLLLSPPQAQISTIMKRDLLAVRVSDDPVDAAQRLRRRHLKMLPVVDDDNVLVGVLNLEAAMDLIADELADDFAAIGAVSPEETFFTRPREAIPMRLPWMAANIFLNLGAVAVIASFENTIAQVVILAAFLPMITDMGGNVGIQALSVSIRSIALGEALLHEYWAAVRKEATIGIVNGLALGALFGVVALFFEAPPVIGLIAGGALAINVFVAGVVGGTMPFLIKRLGKDPAMMTGPVLTTITDITGVTIYLGLATLALGSLTGG